MVRSFECVRDIVFDDILPMRQIIKDYKIFIPGPLHSQQTTWSWGWNRVFINISCDHWL